MTKSYRRRDYFVKKWLQTRFIFYYLAVLTLGGVTLATFIYRRAGEGLRLAIFQSHSMEVTTWEVLRPDITAVNLTVTLSVTVIAVLITLLISWAVARASRVVIRNIQGTLAGRDPESWSPVPRPREFQQFQRNLADGIRVHREKVEALRRACTELAGELRQTRESGQDPDHALLQGLRIRYEKLRTLYQAIKLK